MNTQPAEQREEILKNETLQCDQCRKKWQVAWVEVVEEPSAAHALTCDCGRVLKVVRTAENNPPAMILKHSWGKTIAASLPAFAGGALYPVLSEPVLLTLYMIAWIACAFTFVNEDNRSVSALAGIAIWSIALITGSAAVGALAGHALYWWWQ